MTPIHGRSPDDTMSATSWTPRDLEQLAARGLTPEEAARQLARAIADPPVTRIERPCTIGDGIRAARPGEMSEWTASWRDAAAAGRVSLMIPASGAATRMFQSLLAARARAELQTPGGLGAARAAGDGDAEALGRFLEGLSRFGFRDALAATLAARGAGDLETLASRGPYAPILAALLDVEGLDYAGSPKGVLAFHRDGARARTPLEEHLREAAQVAADGHGRCRVHVTVSAEHRARFEALAAELRARLEPELGVAFEIGFSVQEPATDTIAAAPDGGPFREADGGLLFRPAGHGALLANLGALARAGADLVFLKNVDNVASDRGRATSVGGMRALLGLLARAEAGVREQLARLRARPDAASAAAALAFARETFGFAPAGGPDPVAAARAALDRPLRVAGVVPNTGEPGGGPFWTLDSDGRVAPQIVESGQIDGSDPEQRGRFASATHFNPVFMACALRDLDGAPRDLERWVDPATWIVSRKSAGGRELVALERPGLWNGAMAGWNTIFVEVPIEVFNPVKTVLDLLRPAHQPD